MSNLILISIKSKYVDQILSGHKTIELRKAMPKATKGDMIIIYTTKPVMAVTAIAIVGNIINCTPAEMWRDYKNKIGVDKKSFNEYYKTATKAIGIELENVFKLDAEILLSAIKLINPQFSPPQTFKYLNKFTTLREYKSLRNN
ncbi:ASCH domain-containing protein [Chitinophaga oryziterrae]|uniref:ASCH domain-containing protein n=1 Tax=Chitinophaga oryziterrae TaxID=1031224 RepID=A0A6N8JKU6_9BACT|nr:ASCH domain-containing protein [Chitinophaga oryziterrae]MVT44848.1 ASCH domain-containing protein [Chitinophaga oryziterrae]